MRSSILCVRDDFQIFYIGIFLFSSNELKYCSEYQPYQWSYQKYLQTKCYRKALAGKLYPLWKPVCCKSIMEEYCK